MANIALFHGTGGSPENFWFPWLKENLEGIGHVVWAPHLPNPDHARLGDWLPFALEQIDFLAHPDTILVGHSAGSPLILSILERIQTKISKAILVAAFARPLNWENPEPILQQNYNWTAIKDNVDSITIVNSDNDPWGCNDKAGEFIAEQTDGTLIVNQGEGHMGSITFNQPYDEFPLILHLIQKMH